MSQKTGWYLIRNIIKYACRWKKKNGIQDLEKILWYAQHLIDHLKKMEKVEEENK